MRLKSILFVTILALQLVAAQDVCITVLSTNDLHGHLLKQQHDSVINIGRVAALKAAVDGPVLLIDAGDLAYGMPIADTAYIKPLANLMNLAGYDLAVPGNHEFDGGMPDFDRRIPLLDFPYVSANIMRADNGEPYLDKFPNGGTSAIMDIGGVKLGIFGLTTAKSACARTADSLVFETDRDGQYLKLAKRNARKLRRAGAEVVIAVTHLGKPNGTADILKKAKDISLIIDGDSHEEYVDYAGDSTRVLCQAGAFGFKMAKSELYLKNGKLRKLRTRLLDFNDVKDLRPDSAVAAAENALSERLATDYGDTGFELFMPLWGGAAYFVKDGRVVDNDANRLEQTLQGKLWGRIMQSEYRKRFAQSDSLPLVAVVNGGALRESLDRGRLSGTDLFCWLPNNNEIFAVCVSHSTLYTMLSRSLQCLLVRDSIRMNTPDGSGAFLQWQGLRGFYNPATCEKRFEIEKPDGSFAPLVPNDTVSLCRLLVSDYVLHNYNSYGKMRTVGESLSLGFERQILTDFFESCVATKEIDSEQFITLLNSDLQSYGLQVEGTVPCDSPCRPRVRMYYDGLENAKVECTVYDLQNQDIQHFTATADANNEFEVPISLSSGSVLHIRCTALKNSKPVTLQASTYIAPCLGLKNTIAVQLHCN